MLPVTDITVAAITCRSERFLLVRERSSRGEVLNLPGGHLENGETPEQAVIREVAEETGLKFVPKALQGAYSWRHSETGKHYVRIVYTGCCPSSTGQLNIDENILERLWLPYDDLLKREDEHRYPIVMCAINDYRAGRKIDTGQARAFEQIALPAQAGALDAWLAHQKH